MARNRMRSYSGFIGSVASCRTRALNRSQLISRLISGVFFIRRDYEMKITIFLGTFHLRRRKNEIAAYLTSVFPPNCQADRRQPRLQRQSDKSILPEQADSNAKEDGPKSFAENLDSVFSDDPFDPV